MGGGAPGICVLVKEPNLRTSLTIESSSQRAGTEFIYIGQDRIESDLWRDNRRLEAPSDCHPSVSRATGRL